MTRIIKTDIDCLAYPVGVNIDVNKDKILKLANAFVKIKEFRDEDLNLICMGSSGAIMAAIFTLSLANECTIYHIKKKGENAHNKSNMLSRNGKNIIIDDFIETGATMNEIYENIRKANPKIIIDCLCITGPPKLHTLKFKPRIILCSRKDDE